MQSPLKNSVDCALRQPCGFSSQLYPRTAHSFRRKLRGLTALILSSSSKICTSSAISSDHCSVRIFHFAGLRRNVRSVVGLVLHAKHTPRKWKFVYVPTSEGIHRQTRRTIVKPSNEERSTVNPPSFACAVKNNAPYLINERLRRCPQFRRIYHISGSSTVRSSAAFHDDDPTPRRWRNAIKTIEPDLKDARLLCPPIYVFVHPNSVSAFALGHFVSMDNDILALRRQDVLWAARGKGRHKQREGHSRAAVRNCSSLRESLWR